MLLKTLNKSLYNVLTEKLFIFFVFGLGSINTLICSLHINQYSIKKDILNHLHYTQILSILLNNLHHIDQSRDYMSFRFYNFLHTDDCSGCRTILLYTLINKMQQYKEVVQQNILFQLIEKCILFFSMQYFYILSKPNL